MKVHPQFKAHGIVALAIGAITLGLMMHIVLAQPNNEDDTASAEGLIQLVDPLDEPEYYCIDVPGFGASLNLNGDLTAHTCKPGAEDELFEFNTPNAGQFFMHAYNLCITAANAQAGSALRLTTCNNDSLQQFIVTEAGEIQLANEQSLCIAVADGQGTPTGGPSHLRRDLALQPCAETDRSLIEWRLGVTDPGSI